MDDFPKKITLYNLDVIYGNEQKSQQVRIEDREGQKSNPQPITYNPNLTQYLNILSTYRFVYLYIYYLFIYLIFFFTFIYLLLNKLIKKLN